MVKANLFLVACALAGSMMAQPNNSNIYNSNLSNVFVSNNNTNVNVQSAVSINVQQSSNSNKPKTTSVNQTRRRTVATSTPKPSTINTQATVRRPLRTRRSSNKTNTNAVSVAQVQVTPVQVANVNNANVPNVQEFAEIEAPQEQVLFTNFNPVQTNNENLNEGNENKQLSISLPGIKMPRVYFSFADLSVSHKSFSLKNAINKKVIKLSRKHKAKRGGKIRRYITHNCCNWN